jgi:hypothetical protein
MQTLDLKGKKWTIDLDWETLPGVDKVKDEARKVASSNNSSYGVLVEYEDQFAIGLAKKNSKYPSAALYLALANQIARADDVYDGYHDWIVVEEMGDDKYWMSVINHGIPNPQYDKVFDITTVKDHINDLLNNDTFHIYSPCGEIKALFDGLKHIEDKSVNDLTKDVQTKIKFTKLRGLPNNVVYAGIGLVVLVLVGMTGSMFIDGYKLRQQAEEALNRQQIEADAAKAQYQKQLANYNNEVAAKRNEAIKEVLVSLSATPNELINAWYNIVGSLDLGTHGWTTQKLECDFNPALAENKSSCVISLNRPEFSTNRMLLQDYPDAVITGDTATVTRNVVFENADFSVKEADTLEYLPTSKTWGFDMVSQLQLLKLVNIEHAIEPPSDITFVPPAKPVPPAGMEATQAAPAQPEALMPISIGVSKGNLTIKSADLASLEDLANNVDFKAVGIRKIVFNIAQTGDITWDATLNYYIRPEAVVAANAEAVVNNGAQVAAVPNVQQNSVPVSN